SHCRADTKLKHGCSSRAAILHGRDRVGRHHDRAWLPCTCSPAAFTLTTGRGQPAGGAYVKGYESKPMKSWSANSVTTHGVVDGRLTSRSAVATVLVPMSEVGMIASPLPSGHPRSDPSG